MSIIGPRLANIKQAKDKAFVERTFTITQRWVSVNQRSERAALFPLRCTDWFGDQVAVSDSCDHSRAFAGCSLGCLKLKGQKIRHHGWMSSNSKVSLEEVNWLAWMFLGWTFWLAIGHVPRKPPRQASVLRCTMCGGQMKVVHVTYDSTEVLSEHALAYLDSG